MESRTRRNSGTPRAQLLASLLLLVPITFACAGPTRVTAENQIATARYAIRDAVSKDANLYAPEELQRAMAEYEQAKSQTAGEGIRLAQRATVLARLASAMAVRESARSQLAEAMRVESRSETLRSETIEAVEETER